MSDREITRRAWLAAVRALCKKCGSTAPKTLPGTRHYFHGNAFVDCPAGKLWVRMARLRLLTPRR